VIDALAKKLEAGWTVYGNVALAFVTLQGNTVLLVKPRTFVNNLGIALKELSEATGFKAQDCILIQDDVSLPLGKLRGRIRGSDGGHKGVRSALVAFQTDEFQRLKIGVAPRGETQAITDYVVKPFSSEARPVIATAVRAATERIFSELHKVPTEQFRDGITSSSSTIPKTAKLGN
jgi:PTH1 family peptidyl-tRNA hydrolase